MVLVHHIIAGRDVRQAGKALVLCPGEQVAFLQLKELMIEAYQTGRAAGRAGAVDHIALDVADVDTLFVLLRDGGYELLDDAVRFLPFWARGVRFFTILGPNGEKVEFSQKL